ncbi:MAG: hypothetical protein H0V92_04770 [Pseudonocardiales bacterium]|nr:hypothetical protein [Pseudonocardiales bacterium]
MTCTANMYWADRTGVIQAQLGSTGMAALVEDSENLDHRPENLETAARAVLSGVQDWIADTTTQPWPGAGGQMPNPDARVRSDAIEMWFGDDDQPVLRLRPIRLSDI